MSTCHGAMGRALSSSGTRHVRAFPPETLPSRSRPARATGQLVRRAGPDPVGGEDAESWSRDRTSKRLLEVRSRLLPTSSPSLIASRRHAVAIVSTASACRPVARPGPVRRAARARSRSRQRPRRVRELRREYRPLVCTRRARIEPPFVAAPALRSEPMIARGPAGASRSRSRVTDSAGQRADY
jgi:hypothetical protein